MVPPDAESLVARTDLQQTILDNLEINQEEDGARERHDIDDETEEAQAPPADRMLCLPPPRRVTETHGNSRRKRKQKQLQPSQAPSRGRTQTRTFTSAENRTKQAVTEARNTCKKCRRAGRVGIEMHKSRVCPFEDSVPKPAVLTFTVLDSQDEHSSSSSLSEDEPSSSSRDKDVNDRVPLTRLRRSRQTEASKK